MPFELGVDYGTLRTGRGALASKRLLVIVEEPYEYQAALSDIAGWDVRAHRGDYDDAMRQVRAWLSSHGHGHRSPSRIIGDYTAFQEWGYERLLDAGWSERDIQERGTVELLESMFEWREAGSPVGFD